MPRHEPELHRRHCRWIRHVRRDDLGRGRSEGLLRAREILHNLESGEFDAQGRPRLAEGDAAADPVDQLTLFTGAGAAPVPGPDAASAIGPDAGAASAIGPDAAAVLAEIEALDPDRVAPLDALLLLRRLHERLRGGEGPA